MNVLDEFDAGFGWAPAEQDRMRRTSHAVLAGGRVWVIDPVDGDGLDTRLAELGEPAAVLQLLDRHNRDCAAVAARLGVPLHVTPFGGVSEAPFEVVSVRNVRRWREVALWFPDERVLVCADAVGSVRRFFRAPGEQVGVHPLLRLFPPRGLARLDPLHLLVGHGKGVHGEEATPALRDALAGSRRRIPKWLAGFLLRR